MAEFVIPIESASGVLERPFYTLIDPRVVSLIGRVYNS